MTATDQREQHPEELLHRARAGLPLSARERQLRLEHLRTCDVCRLLEETRVDLLDEASRPGAGKSITELVAATMASFPAPARPAPVTGRRMRTRHPARVAVLGLVAVVAAASVALAARWLVERRAVDGAPEPAATVPLTARGPRRAAAPIAGAPPAPTSVEPAPDGAATLFALATAARRAGNVGETRRAYDRLWREFPGTLEAQTGRVAYGRWLLDRGEAEPAALAFADYLRSAPRGTLAAEARLGLAEALDLLGDQAQARRAWQDVLADPTTAAFAGRAKTRLRALDPRGDAPARAGGR